MIPYGGPYVCRGCGVHHTHENPCETPATRPPDPASPDPDAGTGTIRP